MSDLFATEQAERAGAIFSPCRRWRFVLWRTWDKTLPHATALYMNPSTADEVDNDPTVERWQRRAQRWSEMGFLKVGGIKVTNAFAWRETDSRLLPTWIAEGYDIVGPDNDRHILEACKGAAIVVCGWGEPGHKLLGRGAKLLELMRANGIQPHAFKINASGAPQHPLYIGYDVLPRPL